MQSDVSLAPQELERQEKTVSEADKKEENLEEIDEEADFFEDEIEEVRKARLSQWKPVYMYGQWQEIRLLWDASL